MKPTERTASLENRPGTESTETDGPPRLGSADETGQFTADEPTGVATAGAGVDANATVGQTGVPDGPAPEATERPATVDATADLDPNATGAFDTDGRDRDATGDLDPEATDAYMLSPGVPVADTERLSPSPGGRKNDPLPRISGYEILGVLGAGGMGIVYKARQTRLDRLVALKMILAGAGARPGDLARFEAEARAVAAIDHPNIIKIFEIGEHDGLPYFSLEFLEGGSLSQRIGGLPQPVQDAARIVETLALAMDVAHRRGIVHRDIKPANVLLAADGTPKIADFGLVKRTEADSGQTRSGSILGSPSYMAPEQTTGAEKAGPAADQYALGATLYETLTGRPPFRGSSIIDTIDMVRNAEPVPPSQLLPRLPRDLETICLKALQKDPARRYPDVAAMAEDLRRFRAGEPIVARPVSRPERLWRWCRRNKVVAGLAAVAVGLSLLLLVGSMGAAVAFAGKNGELNRANADLLAANDEAERRRVEAEKARKYAEDKEKIALAASRAAIEQNHQVVEGQRDLILKLEEQFRAVPGLAAMRRDVLGLAIKILETAASSMTRLREDVGWPEKDEEKNWRSISLAHQRIGEILLKDNRLGEAFQKFKMNNEILARLAAADPTDLERQSRLLKSYRQLGYFAQHHMGDSAEALRQYEQSLKMAHVLLQHEPDRRQFKGELANTLGMIGIAETQLGHVDRARSVLEEARAVREALLAESGGGSLDARANLAFVYDRLFSVCLSQGDEAAARRYNDRSTELREQVVAEQPELWNAVYNLAESYNSSGMLRYPMGHDPAGAREFHRKALALASRWVEADPKNLTALQGLAVTLYYEATCALKSGDRDGAAAGYRRCLEIREKLAADPRAKMPAIDVMVARARCGQHGRASTIARDLIGRPALNELVYFQAACGFSLSAGAVRDLDSPARRAAGGGLLAAADASLIRAYTEQAIDCLRKAKEKGYSDVVGLETDPDLEPIRDDPAFRALIAGFPRPSAPRP